MQYILNYLIEVYRILQAMAIYLLLGFLIAGILKYSIQPGRIRRYLGGNNFRSVFYAAILGVPVPLCSCGVIPAGIGLYRNGASRGATQSFLISAPQIGVDSILLTYSMLGLPFAIIRPLAAFLTGIAGGTLTNHLEKDEQREFQNENEDESLPRGWKAIPAMLKYAFVDFLSDIAKWLLIGILIAALISVLLPNDFFLRYLSNPYLSMLLMLAASVPLYVCATGSIPVVAALLMKGLSPGAALVFLIAGPATNAASISVIGNTMGKKSLFIYLSTIIIGSFAAGTVLNELMPASWFGNISAHAAHAHMLPHWLMAASAIILAALMLYALLRKALNKYRGIPDAACEIRGSAENKEKDEYIVHIRGMSCGHCAENVKKGLSSLDGVNEVVVNLESKMALVRGKPDLGQVEATIKQLGYSVKGIE